MALQDGTLVEYDYDSAGRRVAKKVDGVYEQRFLFGDAFGPVALVDAAGAVLDRYVYGTSPYVPDYLVRTSGPDAGTYRLLKDERGSVRMVVNTATGAVAQQLTYDAFGRVLTDTAPGFTPFGYAGGLLDLDTGLVRFGARDYDPETGRWTTQDPIGLGGGDANLYAYVANDPVNGIDPSGLAIAGNPAMDSALGGGFLAALGFDTFARGMANYQLGMLKLSNEATFNQGLRDISQGICQMVAGGIGLGTSTGPMAMASAGMVGAAVTTLRGAAGLSRRLADALKNLRNGKDVFVKNIDEARTLLAHSGLKPFTSNNHTPGVPAPKGTYRGDLLNTRNPAAEFVHPPPNPHSGYAHYNLYFQNGKKSAIILEE